MLCKQQIDRDFEYIRNNKSILEPDELISFGNLETHIQYYKAGCHSNEVALISTLQYLLNVLEEEAAIVLAD